jgi:hypothetical protein
MRLPLRIARLGACFVVRDATGLNLAYVYFENEPTRANILKVPPQAEAMELAKRIARALNAPEFPDGSDPPR